MWPSGGGEVNKWNYQKGSGHGGGGGGGGGGGVSITSSTSKSASSTSTSTSSSSPSSTFHPNPRTMEEVWKDINLSSLHTTTNFRAGAGAAMIYQDFLARPFSSLNDGPPAPPTSVVPTAAYGGYPALEAPPVTMLSLNSGPDEVNILAGGNSGPIFQPGSNVSAQCFHVPFQDVLLGNSINSSSSTLPDLNDGKRTFPAASEYNTTSKSGGGDRRHKRMIKNRESAARSRARKQAYTNELEIEVAHLIEENTRLKKQQQQLYQAAGAQLPRKHALHRTSTAPF